MKYPFVEDNEPLETPVLIRKVIDGSLSHNGTLNIKSIPLYPSGNPPELFI